MINTHRGRIAQEDFSTTDEYWDCDCADNYIHRAASGFCPECGLDQDDSPESRVREVLLAGYEINDWTGDELAGQDAAVLASIRQTKEETINA
jgi:hypothetical protein